MRQAAGLPSAPPDHCSMSPLTTGLTVVGLVAPGTREGGHDGHRPRDRPAAGEEIRRDHVVEEASNWNRRVEVDTSALIRVLERSGDTWTVHPVQKNAEACPAVRRFMQQLPEWVVVDVRSLEIGHG